MQVKKEITRKKAKEDASNEGSYWEKARKEITKDGCMEEYRKE